MPPTGQTPASASAYKQSRSASLLTTLRMTLPLVAMLAAFSPLAAKASVNAEPASASWIPGTFHQIDSITPMSFAVAAPGPLDQLVQLPHIEMPALRSAAVLTVTAPPPKPSIVTPLKKLFCVEYA